MKVELVPREYRVHIDWLEPIEKYSDKFAYSVIWIKSQQQWGLQITFAHQDTHIPSYANKPNCEPQASCVISNQTWLSEDVGATVELCKSIIKQRNPELTEICARPVPVAYKIKQTVTSISYFVVYLPKVYAWAIERVTGYGPVANTYMVKAGRYLANAEDSKPFRKLDDDTALFKTEHEAFKAWKDYVKVAYPAALKPKHQATMLCW